MKVPSEAELIEMEHRAAILGRVTDWLSRRAENLRAKADLVETGGGWDLFNRQASEAESAADVLPRLAHDLDILIGIVRQVGRP